MRPSSSHAPRRRDAARRRETSGTALAPAQQENLSRAGTLIRKDVYYKNDTQTPHLLVKTARLLQRDRHFYGFYIFIHTSCDIL